MLLLVKMSLLKKQSGQPVENDIVTVANRVKQTRMHMGKKLDRDIFPTSAFGVSVWSPA